MITEIITGVTGIIGVIAAIVGALIYFLPEGYYKHSQKIEDDKLMKDLFREFNERYDKINNKLYKILEMESSEWQKLSKGKKRKKEAIIIDYFNICSEEYYWHKENRINDLIWGSWLKGMNDIYNRSEIVRNLWDKECENEGFKSYYITAKDSFFNSNSI